LLCERKPVSVFAQRLNPDLFAADFLPLTRVAHAGRPMNLQPIEYADATPEVRAVFDDIKRTRNVPDVNNFWKYLAHDPAGLKRTWESVKEVMAPGALDPLTKEMIYLAVSVTNGCGYCTASHGAGARKAGMTEAMFGELMAVVGMANETNRLANGYRVPIDAAFGGP
jgi:AhpD family alkylhydroperoxidase